MRMLTQTDFDYLLARAELHPEEAEAIATAMWDAVNNRTCGVQFLHAFMEGVFPPEDEEEEPVSEFYQVVGDGLREATDK